jgi:phage terminase large subunit-like protein
MSQPMKELEALVYSKGIWHDGDPVLGWMLGNVVKKQGRNTGPVKYYYPTKERNSAKIDGAISLIMAVGRAMLHTEHEVSAYKDLTVEQIKERMMI